MIRSFLFRFETCGPEPVLPVPADSLIGGLNSRASIALKTAPQAAVLHKT